MPSDASYCHDPDMPHAVVSADWFYSFNVGMQSGSRPAKSMHGIVMLRVSFRALVQGTLHLMLVAKVHHTGLFGSRASH